MCGKIKTHKSIILRLNVVRTSIFFFFFHADFGSKQRTLQVLTLTFAWTGSVLMKTDPVKLLFMTKKKETKIGFFFFFFYKVYFSPQKKKKIYGGRFLRNQISSLAAFVYRVVCI